MKRFLKIVAIIVIFIVVAIAILIFVTAGSRDIARNFVLSATTGAYDEAVAAMHPELAKQFPNEEMQKMFGASKPYTEVSFSQVQASGSRTTLEGVGRTEDGCESVVAFTLLGDKIIAFDINPLCRE